MEEVSFEQEIINDLLSAPSWLEMARSLRSAADYLEEALVEAFPPYQARFSKPQCELGAQERAERALLARRMEFDRVAQMLYQMSYENALKGVLQLQRKQPSKSHDLKRLGASVGLVVSDSCKQYLCLLSRMNQLGRYRFGHDQAKRPFYGTAWSTDHKRHRDELDAAIKKLWITSGGSPHDWSFSP